MILTRSLFVLKKDLIQRKKMEDDEICYYYWLIEFFTEFIRYSDKPEHEKILLIK